MVVGGHRRKVELRSLALMELWKSVEFWIFHAAANSSKDYDMRFWAAADELVLWGGELTVRDGGVNISGDYKVNGRKIDKAYIGLDKVMNFSITNRLYRK